MVRSKLCHKFLKLKTEKKTRLAYIRQRNYCFKLLRQKKKEENRFWKTACPLFFQKQISKNSTITLFEKK